MIFLSNDEQARISDHKRIAAPSAGLLTAALAGLMGIAGCQEDNDDPSWACDPQGDAGALPTAPTALTPDAGASQTGNDAATGPNVEQPAPVVDAGAPADAGAAANDAGPADAAPLGPVVTKEEKGNRTFTDLKAVCEARGGYMQTHATCASANTCRGFSYFDGEPGELTEHTCASANGCKGFSCVYGAEDSGRTGAEVYAFEEYPPGQPTSCTTCHAVWNGKDAAGNYLPPDVTKFKVWVQPGSTRNVTNWLDLSATAQEHIAAFGKFTQQPDGTTQMSMRAYHKLLSRAEIQRVVAHIRTLTPVITEFPQYQ